VKSSFLVYLAPSFCDFSKVVSLIATYRCEVRKKNRKMGKEKPKKNAGKTFSR